MPNVKISELNTAAALDGTELVPVVQTDVTVRTTTQAIADLASTSLQNLSQGLSIRALYADIATAAGSGGGYAGGLSRTAGATAVVSPTAGSTLRASKVRVNYDSTAGTNFVGGVGNPTAFMGVFNRASAAPKAAGFQTTFLFALPTVRVDQAIFIGQLEEISLNTTLATPTPSGLINSAAFGKDQVDTNLQFMHNDGSGLATKVNLGVAATSLAGKLLRANIDSDGAGNIHYTLTDLDTNIILANGVATTNTPAADAMLYWKFAVCTGNATTTAVSVDFVRIVEMSADSSDFLA